MNKDRPFKRLTITRAQPEMAEVTGNGAGRVKCPKTRKRVPDVNCYPLFCDFCVARGSVEVHCEFDIESNA